MRNVQSAVSRWGVTSALSTGHSVPASYWPGGRRGSRAARFRPKNPRVTLAIGSMVGVIVSRSPRRVRRSRGSASERSACRRPASSPTSSRGGRTSAPPASVRRAPRRCGARCPAPRRRQVRPGGRGSTCRPERVGRWRVPWSNVAPRASRPQNPSVIPKCASVAMWPRSCGMRPRPIGMYPPSIRPRSGERLPTRRAGDDGRPCGR